MYARLILIAVLLNTDAQAAVPKNTQVTYGAEVASISYVLAAWRSEVKGVDIYRCESSSLENCAAYLSLLPPTNQTIQVSGPGMWRVSGAIF